MSNTSARAFLSKISGEEGFRNHMVEELSRKRMELIREAGFEFTEAELDEAKSVLAPGSLGHAAAWFCNVADDQSQARDHHCCGGGLWH